MAMTWSNEEIQRLVDCASQDEMERAFPDINLGTLVRHRRNFIKGLNTSGEPMAWMPVPFWSSDKVMTSDELGEASIAANVRQNTPAGWAPGMELTGDKGSISTGTVEKPITDWDEILKLWGLDPNQFEVVEPVTMKAWDTPAKDEASQEIITKRLFSYKARIQRKTQAADTEVKVDVAGWRERLQSISSFVDFKQNDSLDKTSYAVMVADPQLGKPGTEESIANWKRGVERHLYQINRLWSPSGIEEIVVAFMGDEHEGAVGNYASQPYEVELNYTEQIQLDYDLRVWTIKAMLETGLPVRVSSVPSNHGEHTRFGSAKAMTSIYDNSSTMVTGLVKKLFDETRHADRINWHIANDRADVNLTLSGVKCNFAHGHIAKGSGRGEQKMKSAIERQILGRTDELGDTKLWFTGHYHHFYSIEDRGRTMFGCPALEAEKSSDWFYSQYGVWSKPGMLGLLVGESLGDRGWAEVNVL